MNEHALNQGPSLVDPNSDRLQLALAVARPGLSAWIYKPGEGNQVEPDRVTVEYAVSTGLPYMTVPRDGVVALDLDHDEYPDIGDWLPRVFEIINEWRCRYVQCASGGPNSEHLFIVPPAWRRSDLFRKALESAGVPADVFRVGRPIRPPLAPHHNGSASRLIEPVSVPAAWAILREGQISAEGRALLSVPDGPGLNHSKMLQGCLAGLVNSGVGFDTATRVVWDSPGAIGVKARDNHNSPAERLRKYRAAQDWGAKNPPRVAGRLSADLDELQNRVNEHEVWDHRTVATDRAMYTTMLNIAREANQFEFTAADRRLALDSGLARGTVREALERLEKHELIRRLPSRPGDQSSRYQILSKV